ncbi:MAG: hypothetical protein LBV79_06785 [Candidatus Adiutrix sp.]|jgi:hypothetical protein|nr:hypothetical protein [Candidatus Adiutrix sp.]
MSGLLTLQSSFTGGELSPSLSARVDFNKFGQGCKLLKNFKVQPHGGAVKRPGFLLLDELPGEAALIPFIFNQEQAYALAFGEKWLRVFMADGAVLDGAGQPYQAPTPYTLAQAKKLSVAQSADVLFIACEGAAPQKLKRLGHADWRFEAINFGPPMPPPDGVSAALTMGSGQENGTATPYVYYVTAVDAEGRESELSAGAAISGPASNNWVAGSVITVSWAARPGAVEYRLYKSSLGGRPGFVAGLEGVSYQDYNVAPLLSEGAPKYESPFPNGDYPRVISFFEQRLVFASTPNRPQTIWMSKSGDYANFAKYTPQAADSPWEGTVVSDAMAQIVWMTSLRSLVAGATMMEWEIAASQGAFSAQTAKSTLQSRNGSASLPAIIVGDTILHVARSGAQVRNLKYAFDTDAYGGTDRSILATHLLEKERIVGWTYQQHPDSVVWMVRTDGILLGLTFQEEHDVIAWHRHETEGLFRAVCSVPNGYSDVLYAVVQRDVGGAARWFLERLADRYIDGDYSLHSFLDCSLVYDRPGEEVTRLTGLEHLDGKTVGILSRGAVETPRQVAGGAITLDAPSDRVIVGLPYAAELETMPLEIISKEGASVGRKKVVKAVNIRVHETAGAEVGVDFGDMETVKWRTTEPFGVAPGPFSGDKRAVVGAEPRNMVTVKVRSGDPTPMTLLAIMVEVDVK